MKRLLALALCMLLCMPTAFASFDFADDQQGLPLQECHQVEYETYSEVTDDGALIVSGRIKTCQKSVDRELNGLVRDYIDTLAPRLPKVNPGESCTLSVSIRHSRTGMTWMSFMVQLRFVYKEVTESVRFTTRTYDMATGERVMLTDVFPEDSAAWEMMAKTVEDRVNEYYPDEDPRQSALNKLLVRENLEQMDFTMHGMSLVLHASSSTLYPTHRQLIEIPLYYPEYRPHMTSKAQEETDNLYYYKTVALTFDDGPNGKVTNNILDQLMKYGERATFFVVGSRIDSQPFVIQREHDEGHTVGTHNWEDTFAYKLSFRELEKMSTKVNRAHINTIGLKPSCARAPGGYWEDMSEAYMGWPLIQWTVETADNYGDKGPAAYKTASAILSGVDDGGIIRLHDLRENTIEAVGLILEELQNRGYMLLTVEELFAKDGVKLEPDEVYWRCTDGETENE